MSTLVLSDAGVERRSAKWVGWSSEVSVEELRGRMDEGAKMQIVDVREPGEFAAGHLVGAVNIPLGEVAARLKELKVSRAAVVVCKGGVRSTKAIAALKEAGYKGSLSNLTGGMIAWTQAFGVSGVSI